MTRFNSLRQICTLGLSLITLTTLSTNALCADITLEVVNIDSSEGDLRVAIYNNQADFESGLFYRALPEPATQGDTQIVLNDVPDGLYGVMLYHDKNGNEELDTNLLGMPTEPWGASTQGRSVSGRPGWEDISFTVIDDGARIVIKIP